MTNTLRAYWLTCICKLIGVAASATTIVLPTDEQLIVKSPVIVTATVLQSDVALVDREFQPIQSHNVQRDANGFEKFVTDRIAGCTGAKTYAIENPLLERDARTDRAPFSITGRR